MEEPELISTEPLYTPSGGGYGVFLFCLACIGCGWALFQLALEFVR